MIKQARIKRSTYFDSITLMKIARTLADLDGVEEATALMGTPANLQLLADAGFTPFTDVEGNIRSNDLLIVVRADNETHAEAALDIAEAQLRGEGSPAALETFAAGPTQPRTLEEARQALPEASLAVISVPGMYAALEAELALRAGLHVFLFSDNVSLEDEITLKHLGEERQLLVMGPDCGTARLNGVGLGFVNVVPDGPVGLVGASGTGTQQVMCLLAQAGYGISQAIGCGGRDLSAEVGALTTLHGLRLLQADKQTRVIVLISKPPAPKVAERVLDAAAQGEKPVVVIFVGAEPEVWQPRCGPHVYMASTLTEAARMAIEICEAGQATLPPTRLRSPRPSDKRQNLYLAALFSGGTLCDEALHIWGEQAGAIYSNIPLHPARSLQHGQPGQRHYALDLGADEYTSGRPHPMIDPSTRLKYLREAISDPQVGVILLDIVLGYCAQANPAATYAPLIQEALQQARQTGKLLNIVISLCGTEDDPQQVSYQETLLREAGAEIYMSNAEAAERCLELLTNH